MPSGQSANIMLDVMESRDFYQAIPKQGPLAEQFTSVVNSLPKPISIAQKEQIRVAMLLFGDVDSLENKSLLLSFKRRMRELAIDYRLDIYIDDAEYGRNLKPFQKMERDQPDYIVMTKMGAVQRRFLERFLRSNKSKVILYDFASPFIHWIHHPPLMYIGFDQKKATKALASYLDRQLLPGSSISALVLPAGYLGHARCDLFLDEMMRYGRHVSRIREVSDNRQDAFDSARILIKENPTDFIFSCSQNISAGVVGALKEKNAAHNVQTNAWGLFSDGLAEPEQSRVKVSVLFMMDDLSIAVAEAIKLDLEGKNMPNLYVANSNLISTELGYESVFLMVEQAYHYSVDLWQK
ncbi:hypothetical protein [Marinomonas ushuaiensis]|uniref:hypothetical protein n=1 Tax=Marinomonas ushuaiensis TaxID=263818 RepID=UPI001FE0E9C2|nr:hypothetical protein [Marinomonas ushuaiensis]